MAETAELDLREQLMRIDQMRADISRAQAQTDRARREIWWQPVVVMISGLTAGAAIVGATLLFVKYLAAAPLGGL